MVASHICDRRGYHKVSRLVNFIFICTMDPELERLVADMFVVQMPAPRHNGFFGGNA
jgi:hypothetical protein